MRWQDKHLSECSIPYLVLGRVSRLREQKQNKFLPTVAVKMSINTELSVGASNFPVLSVENPHDLAPVL